MPEDDSFLVNELNALYKSIAENVNETLIAFEFGIDENGFKI